MITGAPINVLDYGADPTGVNDSTSAFTAAQAAGDNINVPKGTYLLNNLTIQSSKKFTCAGYENTKFKQANANNPVLVIAASTALGFKVGISLTDFSVYGATGATVAAVQVSSSGVGAVEYSKFDFIAHNTYSPLSITCDAALAVYDCHFRVVSSYSSTGIVSSGVYNVYDFFVTNCDNAVTISDSSTSSTFIKAISDGQQNYAGWANRFVNVVVEGWSSSTALPTVININGSYHTFDGIVITDVPSIRATNGIYCFNNKNTINSLTFRGSVFPSYAAILDPSSSGSINNASAVPGVQPPLEYITAGATLRNWTFSGNCSSFMLANTVRNGLYYHIWDNVVDGFSSGATLKFGANYLQEDYIDCVIVNLNSTFAALTIQMPSAPVDQQTARITCPSSGITTLTLTPNSGATIVGAPTGITAQGSISFVYDLAALKWYRVS